VQNLKVKKEEVCILMFSMTLLHFERIIWILRMMGAITIFGESSFIFSFVSCGLVIKSIRVSAHLKKWRRKKMSEDECEYFSNQIRMNHLT
jgi:hypothetical protein